MNRKECRECELVKPLNEYFRNCATADGYLGRCKSCDLEARKRRYQENRKSEIEVSKKWNRENPDKHRKHSRDYGRRHLRKIIDKNKERRQNNRKLAWLALLNKGD